MRFVRSVLLVAACMAAAVSHAALQWRGGIDQASKGAAAYITSPQGKVAGLVYGLDPVATGWKLNRQAGTLVQQPFPFQGGYAPLRPASQYGITGNPAKAAVIDVPTSVKVPGKSSTVPARIVEPVAKSTLARMATKALKVLPVVGNAYALGELLEEVGVLLRDGQYYRVSQGGELSPSSPYQSCEAAAGWTNGGTYHECDSIRNKPLASTYPITHWVRGNSVPCSNGILIGSGGWSFAFSGYHCPGTVTPAETPLTDDEAASLITAAASDAELIDAVNQLPDDPNVIDVIARELRDDPEDQEFRWPSALQVPSSTIQVGDPVTMTTTNPDGSTVTTTTTTTATTNGNRIDFVTKTETVTRDPQGNQTSTTTVTTNPAQPNNPNNPQQEDIECGLPGTPPCKIDETGTPAPPEDDGENKFKLLIPNCLKTDWKKCFPELPEINWAFTLPSGCGPIPLPFGKYGLDSVDICPYQPVIHDIMSMLWAGAGLFGAISILSGRRNSEA